MSGFSAHLIAVLLGTSLIVAGSDLCSQQPGPWQNEDGVKVREIHPAPLRFPFPTAGIGAARSSLQFLGPDAMSAADRDLVLANEAEIARRAEVLGFHIGPSEAGSGNGGGEWGYEEAVCPALPNHLILEYSRVRGDGDAGAAADASLFTAILPRRGKTESAHLRVIPAQRRGYSLFTPSASNELTIHDFNAIVAEEEPQWAVDRRSDWLTLGLCYTALASGHVRAALVPLKAIDEHYPLYTPAIAYSQPKGGAEVRFTNATQDASAMEWRLTFAPDGRLTRVKRVKPNKIRIRPVAQRVVDATPTSR